MNLPLLQNKKRNFAIMAKYRRGPVFDAKSSAVLGVSSCHRCYEKLHSWFCTNLKTFNVVY